MSQVEFGAAVYHAICCPGGAGLLQLTGPDKDCLGAVARPGNRIAYLDSLRGLAAIEISCLFHFLHFSDQVQPDGEPLSASPYFTDPLGRWILHAGAGAVDLFFIISGIVFCHVYRDRLTARSMKLGEFSFLRFTRLYPIHVLTLLVVAAMIFPYQSLFGRFPIFQINDLRSFVLNILFLQRGFFDTGYSFNGPAWSLSVEAFLYLLFFLICWFRLGISGFVAMLGAGLAIYFTGANYTFLLNMDIARGLTGFAIGALLYKFVFEEKRYRTSLIVFAFLTSAMLVYKHGKFGVVPDSIWLGAIAFFVLLERWPILQRPFGHPVLKLFGDASLTIYMVHVPVQIMAIFWYRWQNVPVPIQTWWFFPFYALVVVVSALLLHRYFELPMRIWLRKLVWLRPSRVLTQ